jgi:hypothetical protein
MLPGYEMHTKPLRTPPKRPASRREAPHLRGFFYLERFERILNNIRRKYKRNHPAYYPQPSCLH